MVQMRGTRKSLKGSKISYVSQETWIQNKTLRQCVLFGAPYDHTRYKRAIRAAQLSADLQRLPDGDRTEIGEVSTIRHKTP